MPHLSDLPNELLHLIAVAASNKSKRQLSLFARLNKRAHHIADKVLWANPTRILIDCVASRCLDGAAKAIELGADARAEEALHNEVSLNDTAMMKLLLEQGYSLPGEKIPCNKSRKLLGIALVNSSCLAIRLLIRFVALNEAVRLKWLQNTLAAAVSSGDVDQVKELIQDLQRISVSSLGYGAAYAIECAASTGRAEIMDLLFKAASRGEIPKPSSINSSCVDLAIQHNHVHIVKYLIESGFSKPYHDNHVLWPVLQSDVIEEKIKIAMLLLDHGASPDGDGECFLMSFFLNMGKLSTDTERDHELSPRSRDSIIQLALVHG